MKNSLYHKLYSELKTLIPEDRLQNDYSVESWLSDIPNGIEYFLDSFLIIPKVWSKIVELLLWDISTTALHTPKSWNSLTLPKYLVLSIIMPIKIEN